MHHVMERIVLPLVDDRAYEMLSSPMDPLALSSVFVSELSFVLSHLRWTDSHVVPF